MTDTTTAQTGTGDDTAVTETVAAVTTETTATAPVTPTTETKAADTTTLLGGEAKDDNTQVTAPADWPTDWRQKLAGEDKKLLDRLGRMGSPQDLLKSYRALEQRVSSGDLKKALPENATEEQLTEWRKENGIPEKPEDYKIELPQGIVPGEGDKPLIEAFVKDVHGKNWSKQQVNEALGWYFTEQDKQAKARAEADRELHIQTQVDLRAELGAEYKPTTEAVRALMSHPDFGLPEEAKNQLIGGRLANGSLIGDDPAVIKWLANLSRNLDPEMHATRLPVGGADGKGLNDRLSEIKGWMGAARGSPEYKKYWSDENVQAEYRKLLDAQERTKGRAA